MHHQLRPKETTLLLHSVTSLSGSNFLITVFLLLGSFYFYEGDLTERLHGRVKQVFSNPQADDTKVCTLYHVSIRKKIVASAIRIDHRSVYLR